MIEKLIGKIQERYELSAQEKELLASKMKETADFAAGEIIVPEGQKITYSSLLVDGFACRSKHTQEGVRQIMEFQIPGDFVDLHSYPLERLDHSITAITPCRIVKLAHEDITDLVDGCPRLARILWFATMVDASIHREWLVNLGARRGAVRIAHLFCEMFHRCRVVGMTQGTSFPFPVPQTELAQAVGFTQVHTNRMLRELRNRDLAAFRSRTVHINDLKALEAFGDFDPDYLYLQRRAG